MESLLSDTKLHVPRSPLLLVSFACICTQSELSKRSEERPLHWQCQRFNGFHRRSVFSSPANSNQGNTKLREPWLYMHVNPWHLTSMLSFYLRCPHPSEWGLKTSLFPWLQVVCSDKHPCQATRCSMATLRAGLPAFAHVSLCLGSLSPSSFKKW